MQVRSLPALDFPYWKGHVALAMSTIIVIVEIVVVIIPEVIVIVVFKDG